MSDSEWSGKPLVAVCGAGSCEAGLEEMARVLGQAIAEAGAILVCGGLGGVMAAACRGAREAGGLTVGILPGIDRHEANPYVDLALPTGLGHLRNGLITRAAQAVIALPGGPGTLSEVGLALKMGRPVVGLTAWSEIQGVIPAETPKEAVSKALGKILTPDR